MKKSILLAVMAAFVFTSSPVLAQKGANEQALEHASDQAVFNRVGDWFATIGKNDEEKARIKAERKASRAAKRAEKKAKEVKGDVEDGAKEAEKAAKEAKEKMDKEAKEAGADIEKEAGSMKDKMKGMGNK